MFYEIQTFTLPPIDIDDDTLFFRVEVTKKDNLYYGQLLRKETYRLEPTFAPQDVFADEQVYVFDFHTISHFENQSFDSIDDCLNYAYHHLMSFFKPNQFS